MSRAISKLEGVADIQVDLATGQVTVKFDEGQVTAQVIKEAITATGYDVVS